MLAFHVRQGNQPAGPSARHQRHEQRRFLWLRPWQSEAAVLCLFLFDILVDDQRLAGGEHVPAKSLVGIGHVLHCDPLPVFVAIREVHRPSVRVDDADAHIRVVEEVPDLIADQVVYGLHVQLRRQPLLHAVNDRQLGGALLGLLEQPLCFIEQASVLQRHAHAVGQGLQQAHVRGAEGVLAFHVNDLDDAACLVTGYQRHVESRLLLLCPGQDVAAVLLRFLFCILVDHQRCTRLQHMRRNPYATKDLRLDGDPLPILIGIREVNHGSLWVKNADAHIRLIEDVPNLIADGVVNALHVQLGGQSLLDAVNDRQFGVALLGLLKQTLGFIEQAGVLEGGAEAGSYGCHQSDFGFAKGILALVVFDHDRPQQPVTADNGDMERRLALVRSRQVQDLRLCSRVRHDGLPRPDHLFPITVLQRRMGSDGQSLPMFILVKIMNKVRLLVVPADAKVTRVQHLAQLVTHQVDDGLEVQLRRQPLLDAVDDGQLGHALLQLGGALGHALFQTPIKAGVLEGDGSLVGKGVEQVHVGLRERAEQCVGFGIDDAHHLSLRDQRHPHHAQACGQSLHGRGPLAQKSTLDLCHI